MYSGRDKMIELVQDMVDHGYYLFGETVEQFVDRMIGYGFSVEFQQECHDRFIKYKESGETNGVYGRS